MTQRAEFEKMLSQTVTKTTLTAGLDKARADGTLGAGSDFAAGTSEGTKQREAVSQALSGLIIDTSNKEETQQIDTILSTAKKTFADAIRGQTPKTAGETDADYERSDALAETAFTGAFGADPDKRRANAQQIIASSNVQSLQRTGMTLQAGQQIHGVGQANLAEQQKRIAQQAEDFKEAGIGANSTFAQRVGDFFAEIGETGEPTTLEHMVEAVTGIKSNATIIGRVAPEFAANLQEMTDAYTQATVTKRVCES
jgi:hypothetical protein